jgi:hypothetical protein
MPTTNYITPITNRTYADVEYARTHQHDLLNKNIGAWNYTDANRVCNNLKYAAEYMYEQGFLLAPYQMQIKTDWKESDIITYEQLNTMIVSNMNNLKTYSRSDIQWYYIPSIANMNYSLANWLELNIHALATQEPLPPDTYKLTVNSGSGSGNYEARTVVTIQANSPAEGEVFDHWSGDHLENIGNATAAITTYEMPNQDITLTANYTSTIPHDLTIITYTGTEIVNLAMGSIKYIEADPAPEGKVFHHWEISPSSYENNLYEPAASTHFTMPNEAVTLTAVYINKGQKHLIVRNGNGTGYYEYDTYASVSSNKPVNAVFTSWSGATQYLTGPVTQEYNSVRIPDVNEFTIQANWTIPPVTGVELTVVNGVIASTGLTTGVFTEGDRVTIRANSAEEGKVFSNWVRNSGNSYIYNTSSSNTTVSISTQNTTVTATYRDLIYRELTVTTNSGTTTNTYESQDWFSINANPAPSNYTFDRWTGDISGINVTEASTGAVMGTSNRNIVATYRPISPHTVTVHQLSGDVTYTKAEFETQSITAEVAPTGKQFTGWSLSGEGHLSNSNSQTTTYTFGNGDAVLTPNYVNVWTITVINGTINGNSTAVLRQGTQYTIRARNLEVYEGFGGWTKDGPGSIYNAASTVTYFTVGEGDTTITANITQYPDKTLTVYWRHPDTGVDTLVSQQSYRYGSYISGIEAEVAPDKTTFLTWLGDVNILSPSALASTVTINSLTADTTIIATYYYPETPEYYTLTVYNGTPTGQSYATGSQIEIRANNPSQGYEFFKWYGDTQFIVNQEGLSNPVNSVIIPERAITLYAKYAVIGELPLFRVSVSNGKVKGVYTDSQDVEHHEGGESGSAYVDVPAGAQITLIADSDVTGYTFDRWEGNFESAGVDDIVLTDRITHFTMVESDINAQMIRRALNTYTVYPTNASGGGTYYEGDYVNIAGNKVNTENEHYQFTHWTCVDANDEDCISAIENPLIPSTRIHITDKDLWIEAHYTTSYKLTIINGQDSGSGYYTDGQTINSVSANTAPLGMQFDHWEDLTNIITGSIYDPTPTITMKDSIATLTAVYVSQDTNGNSVAVTGNDLHTGIIRRSRTSLINGIFAVGTIVFDGDGCIGTITEVDPDQSDDTDDYRVQKLFYGGNG